MTAVNRGKGRRRNSPGEAGFSFLELLVVVVIILILLALEIPSLFRSRALARQAAAAATLRTLQAAELTYADTYSMGYSPDLKSLGSIAGQPASAQAAGLIDELLASGDDNGYTYIYLPDPPHNGKINGFSIVAVPDDPCVTGISSLQATSAAPPGPMPGNDGTLPIFGSLGSVTVTTGCGQ